MDSRHGIKPITPGIPRAVSEVEKCRVLVIAGVRGVACGLGVDDISIKASFPVSLLDSF
jgi:hypothetical protein